MKIIKIPILYFLYLMMTVSILAYCVACDRVTNEFTKYKLREEEKKLKKESMGCMK